LFANNFHEFVIFSVHSKVFMR